MKKNVDVGMQPSQESFETLRETFQGNFYALPEQATLFDFFERCVRQFPDYPAIIFNDQQLTYAKLHNKVKWLAGTLSNAGVERGQFIPVYIGNSLELPVVFLALMRLGAPFIPLDPEWPAERISLLLDQLNPKLMLTGEKTSTSFVNKQIKCMVVKVDDIQATEADIGQNPLPDSPIYGFYTSGSTGIPKCAVNLHRGVLNRLLYMNRVFHPTPRDVILQNSPPVFDSSIWQIFWPLINGASVVIPESSRHLNLTERLELICKQKVTMTDFVPSIFDMLVHAVRRDAGMRTQMQSLRQILIGGEEMNPYAAYEFMEYFPEIGITNTYGPTETSIGIAFYHLDERRFNPIPIGRPIDNCTMLILDDNLQPVAARKTGDIYIGGVCLGAGYLGDTKKTEAAFIPNPFPWITSEKLYKTGDLGFYMDDGNFYFSGRKDQQVKIDGVRIEIGELERALLQIYGISAAKVLAIKQANDRRELVAFIECNRPMEENIIRETLQRRLPGNMLPKRYIFLEKMPLTHNGKIDKQALEQLQIDYQPVFHAAPPCNEEEKWICSIFSKILCRDKIDPQTNFFQMGGDSLAAFRAILEIREQTGTSLSINTFYSHPSARELAAYLNHPEREIFAEQERAEPTVPSFSLFVKDLFLDNSIQSYGHKVREIAPCVKSVLLTGARGFLGIHILLELLRQTDADIFCLVRAPSECRAKELLIKAADYYQLPLGFADERLNIVQGDMSSPALGLAPDVFHKLSHCVDTVIHCGDTVNLTYTYEQLKRNNVRGIHEIIRFTAEGNTKKLIPMVLYSI